MANHQGFNRCTAANFNVINVIEFKKRGFFNFSDFTCENIGFSML